MHLRRLIAALATGVLSLSLVAAAPAPAQASLTTAEFKSVNQEPDQVVFDSASEEITLIQEMDDPDHWRLADARAYICVAGGGNRCMTPGNFHVDDTWLKYASTENPAAQPRFVTFKGTVPNPNRHFFYYFELIYDTVEGPGEAFHSVTSYDVWIYQGVAYYSFGSVESYGDTRLSIEGPATIPTGTPLALEGTMECYGDVGYKAPDYGEVWVEYRLPGTAAWVYYSGVSQYNQNTGAWSFTTGVTGISATADWRARGYGDSCIVGNSAALTVTAGTGAPPEPPDPPEELPGLPFLTVADVTSTSAVLDWAAPADVGSGITGYRFGWESESGLPTPTWEDVFEDPADPFTVTGLNPESNYTMWIEAITDEGTGPRAEVAVTTDEAADEEEPPVPPNPPEPPDDPSEDAPGKPRGVEAVAGNKQATLTWRAPATGPVTKYQVHRFDAPDKELGASARSFTFEGLKNDLTYTLYVRAGNADGWGPWSKGVAVRPGKLVPEAYKNCTALRKDYPHGVGLKNAKDQVKGGGAGVTDFFRSRKVYDLNEDLDRDEDDIACEK